MSNKGALKKDLQLLQEQYAINAELIMSLRASKKEARAHIKFFKQMNFTTSIIGMTIGIALMAWGVSKLLNELRPIPIISGLIGLVLLANFTRIFISMTRAILATERVARKHDLI